MAQEKTTTVEFFPGLCFCNKKNGVAGIFNQKTLLTLLSHYELPYEGSEHQKFRIVSLIMGIKGAAKGRWGIVCLLRPGPPPGRWSGGSRACVSAEFLSRKCARICRITVRSSTQAAVRTGPSHLSQVSMSMLNTRFSRWAQVIAIWRSASWLSHISSATAKDIFVSFYDPNPPPGHHPG